MEHNIENRHCSGWACVNCETIGRSHIQEGTVCQDKTFSFSENGVTAFALADGAGSAKLSHYGAQTVTDSVCRLLCKNFEAYYSSPSPADVKIQIHQALIQALEQTAANHGCGLRDLASTLLAVAVCDDRCLLLHIGDGVIGYVKEGQLRVLSAPSNGEFANTTTFVTSSNALRDMRIRKGDVSNVLGFVMMSDGCEASLYSKKNQQLAPVLHRLISRLSITSADYLTPKIQDSLDQVVSQKTRDDCSLVLAAKMEKTYAQLSDEELDEYFEIDTPRLKPRVAVRRRKRFVELLDFMELEKTNAELARFLDLKDCKYAIKHWVTPLMNLGYVIKTDSGKYRRIVGLASNLEPEKTVDTDTTDKENVSDE